MLQDRSEEQGQSHWRLLTTEGGSVSLQGIETAFEDLSFHRGVNFGFVFFEARSPVDQGSLELVK